MKTLGETITKLKEKWGNYDSEILLNDEVKKMNPEERESYLEQIADLYLQANSENLRAMIQAQREAYTEGNCSFYDDN
jgi:hypothetical protein